MKDGLKNKDMGEGSLISNGIALSSIGHHFWIFLFSMCISNILFYCILMIFRRGTVMCKDVNEAEWVYFIKSGTCRVLKSLESTKPSIPGLENQHYSTVIKCSKGKPYSREASTPGRLWIMNVKGPTNRCDFSEVLYM